MPIPTRPRRAIAVTIAAAMAILVLSIPVQGANPVHRVPAWIDSSGNADVTKPLQRFVDSVPDGSTISFPSKGFYRLSQHGIRVDGRSGLTFDGNGSKLKSRGCAPENSVFAIGQRGSSSDIVIRDFILAGSNKRAGTSAAYKPGCEHAHGISIHRSRNIHVRNVKVQRVNGDCIYVGGGGYSRSYDIELRNSTCRLTGRQGAAITAGTRIHIENVGFWSIAIIAFDIEPNKRWEGASDVVFTRNRVGRTGRSRYYEPMFFGANGNLDAVVRDVEVSYNLVTREPMKTLVGDEDKGWSGGRNHRNIRFIGNESPVRAKGPVLHFKHVSGLVVRDNTQPLISGPLARFTDSVQVAYKP